MWNIVEEILSSSQSQGINIIINTSEQSLEMLTQVREKYFVKSNTDILWENISESVSKQNKDAWRWVRDFVSIYPCIMFFNPIEAKSSIIFENGENLVSILEDTYHFEFYLTNQNTEYLICFNHHDVLIACGTAMIWLEKYTM